MYMVMINHDLEIPIEVLLSIVMLYTLKTGIAFGNGSSIPNFLPWVFHSQIKIKCVMNMINVNPIPIKKINFR